MSHIQTTPDAPEDASLHRQPLPQSLITKHVPVTGRPAHHVSAGVPSGGTHITLPLHLRSLLDGHQCLVSAGPYFSIKTIFPGIQIPTIKTFMRYNQCLVISGPYFNIKTFSRERMLMIKIFVSYDGNPYSGNLYIEMTPWWFYLLSA